MWLWDVSLEPVAVLSALERLFWMPLTYHRAQGTGYSTTQHKQAMTSHCSDVLIVPGYVPVEKMYLRLSFSFFMTSLVRVFCFARWKNEGTSQSFAFSSPDMLGAEPPLSFGSCRAKELTISLSQPKAFSLGPCQKNKAFGFW